MKITAIKTFSLGYMKKLPPLSRGFALVRVETDAGLIGYGEASTSYGHFYPTVVETIINDVILRAVIGKDPLDIRGRLSDMKLYVHPWLGWEGIAAQVIGAVEIALWDILGKAREAPISHLFGAHREKVPLYGTGTAYLEKGPDWHGHFFDTALEHGFRGVKTRIGNNPTADLAQIAGVREHIGPEVALMVDAYWSYSPDSAIKLANKMADYDVYFFEEPVPQYMLDGLARLHAQSPVRIALGERIYSLSGFENVIYRQAADVLQPNPTVCGGILESVEIAALIKANALTVFPHVGGLTAVGIAANLHLAAITNCAMLEYDLSPYQPLRDELLHDPIFSMDRIEAGCLKIPTSPGLGIEVNETVFEKYPYEPGNIYPDVYPQLGAGRL